MFKPKTIYYEKEIINYPLGKELLEKFKEVPQYVISNHNNIPEMRSKENKEFSRMKQNLIIGVRKTHKFVPNHKVSDYLVPYTSSGCAAMCLYCYLVCHYNKCSYLRIFVNREEMLKKIVQTAEKSNNDLVFEIGSNSDLVLENTITGNLVWTIVEFSKSKKGFITFPTKFDMVDSLLNLPGKEKVIFRMSLNPEEIISKVELGTSSLKNRIEAVIKMKRAGYRIGILIAPIILLDNYKELYYNFLIKLKASLPTDVLDGIFFELIFMTYSFVHNAINTEAFPKAIKIYDSTKFTSKGLGKYSYKENVKEEAKKYIEAILSELFPNVSILYCV